MSDYFYDAIIIGGGFFGCKISTYLKNYVNKIILLEKEHDLLQRASYVNQARVHNGYHYPRSLLTALRSRVNFPRFVQEYSECIDDTFEKYYAVGKIISKVNASQFKQFCNRIQAPIEEADWEIKKLFNPSLVDEVFKTKEYAFDSVKLKETVRCELEQANVEIRYDTKVVSIKKISETEFKVIIKSGDSYQELIGKYLFNCTYSSINEILQASQVPKIPLKHEFTEMALVDVPEPIKYLGITLMCGPFFSIMPFPSRNLHTLSHVRYTPHCYWQDTQNVCTPTSQYFTQLARKSNYPYMIRDAMRYIPILEECQYVDSLWEVKTVLPQSEVDDSRPILFSRNPEIPNLISVLGGKIDNVYDLPQELEFLMKA